LNPKLITRPPGTKLTGSSRSKLLRNGERLWNDKSLSTNGLSCASCHQGNKMFQATFTKPYPHKVAMPAAMAGKKTIALDEMVQICLVVPMAGKPLPWQSHELAALTTYTAEVQKRYVAYLSKNPCAAKVAGNPCAANPCAAKNPCAARNPCAANPCAAKNPCAANPCAAKNPCAANPCAAKNPCGARNPCGAKKY
jgi:cytochrome c